MPKKQPNTETKETQTKQANIPLIACDFGYGMTKAFNGSDKPLGIRSLVGDPIGTIKYQTGMQPIKVIRDMDWLSVLFPENDQRYFIGDLARRQSEHVYYITDKDKLSYASTKALINAAIAILLPETVVNKPVPIALNVVTGLPVSYYIKAQIEGMQKLLVGEHAIDFDWDRNNSYAHKYKFKINGIKIIPQPVGTFYGLILDENGEFVKGKEELASSTVAIIDIGYGTTDYCILNAAEYIERGSRSSNTAMSSVYGHVAKRLSEHASTEIPAWQVEPVILKGEKDMPIRISGVTYNLEKLYHKAVDAVFEELMAVAKGLWRKEYQIDTFILAGGGSYVFADKFQEKFGLEGQVIIADDPMYSNVRGYHKYGRRTFK